jgi:hypothetical protein
LSISEFRVCVSGVNSDVIRSTARDMTSEIILQSPIDLLAPNGERLTVFVEIGRPYKTSDGPWACPVKIRSLYDNLPDMRGQDSLQSLCLAASLVRSLLAGVIESDGRLLHPNTNDPYDLEVAFGRIGNPLDGNE